MPQPVGLSEAKILAALAQIEAQGEISNIPPPRLQQILDKARAEMSQKPDVPPGQNPP